MPSAHPAPIARTRSLRLVADNPRMGAIERLLLTLSALWGSSFLFAKVAVTESRRSP